MTRPLCELCELQADWFDPLGNQALCNQCAIDTDALTRTVCWLWNDRAKDFLEEGR